ncbi:unnamed protein product [Ilex paraguariensis]|uniref:Legume lectin domain-containing protein n=1 Tax=Ilex paraguariensis TaxID=185542 RepID=A0ABC8UW81_9AQUA
MCSPLSLVDDLKVQPARQQSRHCEEYFLSQTGRPPKIVVVNCDNSFIFYEKLKLGEVAEISPGGLLKNANETSRGMGSVFYSLPLSFKNSSNGDAFSFSTMFVFSIVPEYRNPNRGLGMGFAVAPAKQVSGVLSSEQFGLINMTQDGDPNNHAFSIEFDTNQDLEVGDIDANHVGLNLNSIRSTNSTSAEVACGRRPIQSRSPPEEVILVDWVMECWRSGEILKTADPKLNNDFEVEEMELVLKVGLLCSHPLPAIRPSISQVLMYLKSHASMPENLDALLSTLESWQGLNDTMLNHCVSETKSSRPLLTTTKLFTGR